MIAHSLYHRAKGYSWTEQQAVKVKEGNKERIEIVEVERRVPPDTAAAFIWLKNRRRRDWRDRHEVDVTNRYEELDEEGRLEWAKSIIIQAKRLLASPLIEHDEPEEEE